MFRGQLTALPRKGRGRPRSSPTEKRAKVEAKNLKRREQRAAAKAAKKRDRYTVGQAKFLERNDFQMVSSRFRQCTLPSPWFAGSTLQKVKPQKHQGQTIPLKQQYCALYFWRLQSQALSVTHCPYHSYLLLFRVEFLGIT
eukprot:3152379-Amphidinium_carterae.1